MLIAINVAVFAWQYLSGNSDNDVWLLQHGALYGPLVEHGQWWRLVTGAFLHASLMHIAFNMFALYQVGTFVEYVIGPARMLALYVLAMLASSAAVVYFDYNTVTVGASGAIFGLFGALVAIGLRMGERGRSLIGQTLPIIAINLGITFLVPQISRSAHVAGLISGFIAGLALFEMRAEARPQA